MEEEHHLTFNEWSKNSRSYSRSLIESIRSMGSSLVSSS